MWRTTDWMASRRGGARVAAFSALVLALAQGAWAQRGPREEGACRVQAHVLEGGTSRHRASISRGHSPAFSAYDTAAIELDLFCRGAAPPAEKTSVKLYLPDGELYRALPMNVAPHDQRRTRRAVLRLRGSATLPVRGTFITQNQLFGEWRAELCRQLGSRELCEPGLSFELLRD